MKKLLILLALPVAILYSCKSGPTEAEQKAELEQHVMAVHDSAMAEMDQIFKLRRNLETLHDTLATQQADSATLQLLQQNITGLNEADERMMEWMRNYSAPDSLQHDKAMNYLQQELQKIERVKITMDSTIEAARQTYQQHEPTN